MDFKESNLHEKLEQKSSTLQLQSPHPEKYQDKVSKILQACKGKHLKTLRELATSEGGLVSDFLRRQAWPLLLENLPAHTDEDQVRLDVNRSFVYYPRDQSSTDLIQRKNQLFDLITSVLRRYPYLSYFQGYHDICQVFMLVLESDSYKPALTRLSLLRIRDFMLPTFSHALAQLHLIPSIIQRVNPMLWKHLSATQPFFALSGTLTMYSHDIPDYEKIARLFDVLLAREAVFSIYLFAQIVLQQSDELFKTPSDEPEILHSILSKLPNPLGIEALIKNTANLFEMHPPEDLRGWRSISNNSVLKTTRWIDQALDQSLDDGQKFFVRQVRELEWIEKRQLIMKKINKFWKPTLTVSLPIVLGILLYWWRKSFEFADIFRTWPCVLNVFNNFG
ncbi:putative gtpase-activating protein gyp10 [Erysiphe necator]|uniref:Putative gtpase-activating protein gyp10 n=1 Tax=Uncinula necator TaxID=52586 RepID=A0A0B1PAK6_UNCNE|nr:putative gtpase-activating protein gyp10 [Erysiphe necator]